jgi:microcystin degradation protein MlrC
VRQVAGDHTAVGAELDLHCSITPAMVAAADALVTFKEYPHIDPRQRALELYALCRGKVRGDSAPVIGTYDCRMVSSWHTTKEPMSGFVRRMQDLEGSDGVLSVSFAHGFPWGDVPEATAKVIVVTDGDAAKANALAERLGREIWDMRHQTVPVSTGLDEALDRAAAADGGPVVLADIADNPGGGAPSDSTFMLRAMLDRQIGNLVSGLYWDPLAVRLCKEAGEGATLDLRIGGKCCAASGLPVDLTVDVKRIVENAQETFGEVTAPLGDAVWVQAPGDVDLVLNAVRTQTFHPDAFTQFGIDLSAKKMVVVKSSQHFYAGFAPIAHEVIYVAAEGTLSPDFANLPFRKLTTPYWPKVEDPFA